MHSRDGTKPLIGAEALAGALSRGDIVVVDLRPAAAFGAGHIPGSVNSDYVTDGWRASRGGAPGFLPEAGYLSELIGGLGITPDSHVVIVPPGQSSGDFSIAARIYWTLKAAGHRRLSILDGGFAAWRENGGETEEGAARPVAAAPRYPVRPDGRIRATLPDVEVAVAGANTVLLDARGPKSFTGDEKSPHAKRAGRLPRAIHVDAASAFDAAATRLRPDQELEQAFASVPDAPLIVYCNTGQAAATDWFVLSELMGRPNVALYDGSMSEWTQDPDRPVETG